MTDDRLRAVFSDGIAPSDEEIREMALELLARRKAVPVLLEALEKCIEEEDGELLVSAVRAFCALEVGERWVASPAPEDRGLSLVRLGDRVPGDRYDEPRKWCMVVRKYEVPPKGKGYIDYEIGHQDGWHIDDHSLRWRRVKP